MTSVAIVGGGPGGLMSAYLLQQKCKPACDVTLFEGSSRVGGKILTRAFDSAPVIYEAGVAECYDYSMIGHDPLRQLVDELGLETVPTDGGTVILNGRLLRNDEDIGTHCGGDTIRAIRNFRARAAAMLPVEAWQASDWQSDNRHPWARLTCEDVLNDVPDPAARQYLRIAAHSDLATEPHSTTGLNGLKNFLMDVPGYVSQYSIQGGMEMLPRRLGERLTRTRMELECSVIRIQKNRKERYSISYRRGREIAEQEFDALLVCLPHNWLNAIEWGGERLRRAMTRHIAYYDRPGHYLRISLLFKKPFWCRLITGSWFMLDAFGGCCVYDEGTRHNLGGYGVLGWLLAGTDALSLGNLDDASLVARALESLPDELYEEARDHFLEGKVHRWAAVSGQPGGFPVRDTRSAHIPEPTEHSRLFLVGDYLFDSTLNGVFDSANVATDLLHSWMAEQRLPDVTSNNAATVELAG